MRCRSTRVSSPPSSAAAAITCRAGTTTAASQSSSNVGGGGSSANDAEASPGGRSLGEAHGGGPGIASRTSTKGPASSTGTALARARGAPDAATDLTRLALRLTPATARDDLISRSLSLAACLDDASQLPEIRAVLEPLIEQLPSGSTRVRALLQLAYAPDDDVDTALVLLEQAHDHAGEDWTLLAHIQAYLSNLAFLGRCSLHRACEEARRAVAYAEHAGHPAFWGERCPCWVSGRLCWASLHLKRSGYGPWGWASQTTS
jgi:hypothetical protein